MPGERLQPRPHTDFIVRLSQSPIIAAIEELVWNAFDENARQVTIDVEFNRLHGATLIQIADDGRSLSRVAARKAFSDLGNSNKPARKLDTGEQLHGSKGEGRFKALSLGNRVEWTFTYPKGTQLWQYQVVGESGRSDPFYLTAEVEAPKGARTGCTVVISQITRSLAILRTSDAARELTVQFAPSLLKFPDRKLFYRGKPINPRRVIQERKLIKNLVLSHEGQDHAAIAEIIHWDSRQTIRDVLLCSKNGVPYYALQVRNLPMSGNYTVFVRSELFDRMNSENQLTLLEMANLEGGKQVVKTIRGKIRNYFQKRAQAKTEAALERLKQEGSYPYKNGKPKSEIEEVERKVFDVCTVNIIRNLRNFNAGMDVEGRTLLLRMIKEALSQNPTSVGKIIREVCKLPEKEANTFAGLIEDVPLTHLVHASKMVTDRLNFLKFFEAIVYLKPFDRVIRERTQLHRIVDQNTWLFGEEYAIGTSDKNIRAILKQHIGILGREHLAPEMDEADIRTLIAEFGKSKEATPESWSRIPDLMLWQEFKERRPDEYEFLVIELKRPGVPIGRKEINQIEDYASSIVQSDLVETRRTSWVFILVSTSLDPYAQSRVNGSGLPHYTIHKDKDLRYEIRVMPWNSIIRSAEARHEHYRKWLNHNPTLDRAMELSREAYKDFLPSPSDGKPKKEQKKGRGER